MKAIIQIKKSNIKSRITWAFNPVTRVKKSKKIYFRKNFRVDFNA